MKKKWYKNFAEWKASAVRESFGLTMQEILPELQAWIGGQPAEPPQEYARILDTMRASLKQRHFSWNEYELMSGFIAPLLTLVSFGDGNCSLFHQRPLSLQEGGQVTEGKVDGLVALGIDEPEVPFFFLHEYKKSQGYDADPEGQLLIAMVAAQRLNDDGLPLYGCYIVGSYWRFVLLDGKTYAVSQGYDATDAEELRIIWSVLQHTKRIIEKRVEAIIAAES